jgi:hypothetical protein
MKSEVIKAKFLCKNAMSISDNQIYEKGKIYDGFYETYSWEDGYKTNGGWKTYWVIDNKNIKHKINRSIFNAVFYDVDETRDIRINEILN